MFESYSYREGPSTEIDRGSLFFRGGPEGRELLTLEATVSDANST